MDSINAVVYLTGTTWDINGVRSIYTLKYDSSDGSEVWNKTFSYGDLISQQETATSIVVDGSFNVYVTGYGNDLLSTNFYTLKYEIHHHRQQQNKIYYPKILKFLKLNDLKNYGNKT